MFSSNDFSPLLLKVTVMSGCTYVTICVVCCMFPRVFENKTVNSMCCLPLLRLMWRLSTGESAICPDKSVRKLTVQMSVKCALIMLSHYWLLCVEEQCYYRATSVCFVTLKDLASPNLSAICRHPVILYCAAVGSNLISVLVFNIVS